MGTPQFPDLGKHCSLGECRLVDFLPFTCDRCRQVFCLEHRGYNSHHCPKADAQGVTVVICPLCAKGVRLIPGEDPNVSWEKHANSVCDPSNFEKVTKKKKCPVPGCRELLTFSNTIKCRDCTVDHCLKHRFGPDHKCPGPKRPVSGFNFRGPSSKSRKEVPKGSQASSTPWATSFWNAASSFKASAEASLSKLSSEFSQAVQVTAGDNGGQSSGTQTEVCPQCNAKFSSVTSLVDHVQKVHEKVGNSRGSGVLKQVVVDVCPKCSRGFRDPVELVQHVERDHGGTSRAKR